MSTKKCTEVEGNGKEFLKYRARRFCFVWYNYNDEDEERMKAFTISDIHYLCYGYEICPSTGKAHLQGYVEFPEAKSGMQMLKKLLGRNKLSPCHIRGSLPDKCRLANIRYCKKAETGDPSKAEKFIEYIFKEPEQGKRTDVYNDLMQVIEDGKEFPDIAREFPEESIKYHSGITKCMRAFEGARINGTLKADYVGWIPFKWQKELLDELHLPNVRKRTIIWYNDPAGNHGKSDMADYLEFFHNAELLENGKTADLAHGWQKKPICIFDMSRSCEEQVNYGALESIKSGRIFSGKYDSGLKRGIKPHLVVFANWPPIRAKMTEDKLLVRTISDTDCVPWTYDLDKNAEYMVSVCPEYDSGNLIVAAPTELVTPTESHRPVIVDNYVVSDLVGEDNIANLDDYDYYSRLLDRIDGISLRTIDEKKAIDEWANCLDTL